MMWNAHPSLACSLDLGANFHTLHCGLQKNMIPIAIFLHANHSLGSSTCTIFIALEVCPMLDSWAWCKLANFLDLISGGWVSGMHSHCHHVDMAVYLGLITIGCVRKVVYLCSSKLVVDVRLCYWARSKLVGPVLPSQPLTSKR
jgi:hypothetical protein